MDLFFQKIREVAEKFKQLPKKPIRVIGHLDTDGLSSAAIMAKAFEREKYNFSISFVRQVDKRLLDELSREDYEIYFFIDLGSSMMKDMEKKLKDKKIFILDHHIYEEYKSDMNNLNPSPFVNYEELSAAGVCYLFAKALNPENKDLGFLALTGAIGDGQERKEGFVGINLLILNEAVDNGYLELNEEFYLFGSKNRPIYKSLEYCFDPYIPGVTGNEEGAIKLLEEIGIEIKNEQGFRKTSDLNEDELKKIVTSIILKRMGSEKNPEDVLRKVYKLKDSKRQVNHLRELSTLLNACARLGKISLGISVCLDPTKEDEAIKFLEEYRKKIGISLDWFYRNKEKFIEGKNYVIINAENNIDFDLISVIASIIAYSNIYDNGKMIFTLANNLAGDTKISARVAGTKKVNLRDKLIKITKKIGDYESGGHNVACGAIIPQEKELEFIETATAVLDEEE
ncbi:MAG: DHH family phosphoesterase [Candidatus Nanoarchaeia archaeon]|nr:DHH family phosphoesterase [Candidatus Nanoarchaeia archaeon]